MTGVLQVEHANLEVKERLEKVSGHYTLAGIKRIAE